MRVLLQNKLFAIANFLAALFVIVSGKTVVNAAIFLLVLITVSKYGWPLAKNYGKIHMSGEGLPDCCELSVPCIRR